MNLTVVMTSFLPLNHGTYGAMLYGNWPFLAIFILKTVFLNLSATSIIAQD